MSRPVPGRRAVAEALAAGRDIERLLVDARAERIDDVLAAAEAAGVEVERLPRERLDTAAEGVAHQGLVALAGPPPRVGLDELADVRVVVVCDGITDPHNLGAIARTAEVAGAGALVLPRHRASPVTPAAEKAAAGAFSWLPVAEVPGVPRALEVFAGAGRWTVGLAGEGATDLWDCAVLSEPLALVVGSEGAGLARLVRERCDALVRIPTVGRIASLNASVAAGVALLEVSRQQRAPTWPD